MLNLIGAVARVAREVPSMRRHLVPLLKRAQAIQVEKEGRRVYLYGKTYPIKDDLKSLGARFDGQKRAWWFSSQKWNQVKEQVESLLAGGHPQENSQETPQRRGGPSARQVDYALMLIKRLGRWGWHDSDMGQGGSPPTQKDLEGWSSRNVSEFIDSLKSEF